MRLILDRIEFVGEAVAMVYRAMKLQNSIDDCLQCMYRRYLSEHMHTVCIGCTNGYRHDEIEKRG